MIRTGCTLVAVFCAAVLLHAAELSPLHGTCGIAPGVKSGQVDLRLERDGCGSDEHCDSTQTGIAISSFSGFSAADFARDGSDVTARITAEAGTLACSGTVRESRLSGKYTFTPDAGFVERMKTMGYTGLDSEKLLAYTMFDVKVSWIESLKQAGLRGMNADNILALRIFKADAAYVKALSGLGYTDMDADKLIALKVHKVTPAEVREVQGLGYKPTLDELVQLRIFHITPEFIQRMRARGLKDLTIAKLVQIRIFKLAE